MECFHMQFCNSRADLFLVSVSSTGLGPVLTTSNNPVITEGVVVQPVLFRTFISPNY